MSSRDQIGISPDAATLAKIDRLCVKLAAPGFPKLRRATVALAALRAGLAHLEAGPSLYKEETSAAPSTRRSERK